MPIFGPKKSVEDVVFDMKFSAKSLSFQAKRLVKEEKKLKSKVKKALKEGQPEIAAIHAQSAIAKHGEVVNMLRLSAKVDAAASQLQSQMQMTGVTKQIGRMNGALSSALESMDINKVAAVMDKFETQVGALDTQSQFVGLTMGESTGVSVDQSAVGNLLAEIAEQEGLELVSGMDAPTGVRAARVAAREEEDIGDDIARLDAL